MKEKLDILLSVYNIDYEIEEFPNRIRINFNILDIAEELNIEFYEEGVGYYKVNNSIKFIDKQIDILKLMKKLVEIFPNIEINQDHMGICVFIDKQS